MDLILHGRYKLSRRIGKGSYGEVWEGYDTLNKIIVAIKIEDTTKNPKDLQLRYEYNVYSLIGLSKGFPKTFGYTALGNYNYMIMEPVGHSLEQLYTICSKRFTLQTVLHIADQLIERLQQLHSRYYIHRDIKPDNFAIGIGKENRNILYIIDFGLAQRYVDRNNRILPMRDKCQPTGNARYASLNNHLGCEQSRRDDLEGVAYMLIYFLTGKLPWVNACSHSKDPIQRMKIIGQIKLMTSISTICQDTPPEFETFLRSVRQLRYEEEPKYDEYRKLFRDLFRRECLRTAASLQTLEKYNIDTINKEYENHSSISNNTNDNNNNISRNQINNTNKSINSNDNDSTIPDPSHSVQDINTSNDLNDNFLINDDNAMSPITNGDCCENRNEDSDLNLKLYLNRDANMLDHINEKRKLSARSSQDHFPTVNQQNNSLLIQNDEDESKFYDNFQWDWELIEDYKPLITLEKQELFQGPIPTTSSLQKKKMNASPPILQPRIKNNPLLARKNSKFRSNYSKVAKRMSPFG